MGFKTPEIPYELKVGRDINTVFNLHQVISEQQDYFDFVLVDICNALNFRTDATISSRDIALTRADTCVKSHYWSDFVLAKINSYMTDCDSPYEHIRLRSEAIMTQEINFAMHLSVHAVVVDMPKSSRIENFARILDQYFQNVHTSMKFILRIEIPSEFQEAEEQYEKYTQFKMLCGHYNGLQIILQFGANLPSWDSFSKRWTGDKIFGVQLDTDSFLTNQKGYPVLSKAHQETFKWLMKQNVNFILKGKHPSDDLDKHYQYLCHLFKNHDVLDEEEKIEVSYRNFLQSPLQPLADNLEAATYEVFENDTIKYDIYEDSLYRAYQDKKKYGRFFQTNASLANNDQENIEMRDPSSDPDEPIVVMYFGAGRGPLIRRAIKAAQRADVKIKVIALDKNPNAIVTLRNMIIDENLSDRVTLFAGDMRKIAIGDLQGDILMSELLGSFGDNELSPECLNPTDKFLKKGGIFIPFSYTNYVVPISSQILWNEVNVYANSTISNRISISQQLYPFELPYVVKIYSATYPCGDKTQEVFTFRHIPYPDDPKIAHIPEGEGQSMRKYDRKIFVVKEEQSEIHGFGGYFTAELYQEIIYSTNPEVHTPKMHSWFPMYFPVKEPFIAFKGQEVIISIWRNNSQAKVWYEWSMSVYDPVKNKTIYSTHIHNINGRGFSIGL
ncbi:protein arginine n-methyltransferase [Stylonychia lemnae]|uniref:Protein arginine N-methyltransferase n=1 Tax=Stylonychia lemnae TaxID=5949 RepID=A0A078A2Z5_STYLE|nr:protein arginine n-methyltransferase [Stylonychia lemnae]|eukprot:CDW76653.1 protein arginine n-methyltransferase [Stylonychia lemnae]